MLNRVMGCVAALTLAITFVAAGFAACCLPPTTSALAGAVSGMDNPTTPFSHDDLVLAALVTRDYTVGSNDREAVFAMLHAINENADTPYAHADEAALAAAPEEYALDANALSHLDDVHAVVSVAYLVLAALALVALLACVACGRRGGARLLGGALAWAGCLVLALFLALAAWALVDFFGFFAVFHSLFFADGTWTFSYDSLLITMYPTAFWMGMGGVWLAVTGLLSILAVVFGMVLRRRAKNRS